MWDWESASSSREASAHLCPGPPSDHWSLALNHQDKTTAFLLRGCQGWSKLAQLYQNWTFFLKIYPKVQISFFGATLNELLVNSSSERCSTHSDFGGYTHKLRVMGTRKEVRKKEEREKKDRHLPNIQGGVPGGRFFLTSMFCFIKAAN